MIFYFSGTGNSRYAAQAVAEITGGETVCLNGRLERQGERWYSAAPYVFICPTYGWRLPRAVEQYIRSNVFTGSGTAYFLLTCGDSMGNAAHWCEKLCRERGLSLRGVAQVVMPENYIALFRAPSEAQEEKILEKADRELLNLALDIKLGRRLPPPHATPAGRLQSRIVNPLFYRFVIRDRKFRAGEGCISCGRCVHNCPLHNITLSRAGRPQWGGHCTHCMACICGCPTEAIEYGRATRGKRRYQCPAYEPGQLMRRARQESAADGGKDSQPEASEHT